MRILSHNIAPQVVLLAFSECAAGMLAFYGGAFIRFGGNLDAAITDIGMLGPRALLFVAFGFLGLLAVGLYRPRQRATLGDMLMRLLTAVLLAGAANVICYYLIPQVTTGRGSLALAMILYFIFLCTIRTKLLALADNGLFRRRVLVVGAGTRAQSIAMLRRRSDQRNFKIVGYLRSTGDASASPVTQPTLACETLRECVQEQRVDEIVVAMDDRRNAFPTAALLECRTRGVAVTDLISFLERETGKVSLDVLQPGWLIYSQGFRRGLYHTIMKRCSDLALSFILFLLMSPLLVATALAILVESRFKGPILYRQKRVGFEGKIFDALKFRSMVTDAEADGVARWASEQDNRVTRVGAAIRRFRIDELPQIINVLRGEMSFVGPRPERPEFVAELAEKIPFYNARHCVKPGIAGWAQLCYPYGASIADARQKLQYDLYYVKNHGVAFDVLIILQTLEVVLWGRSSGMAGPRRWRHGVVVPLSTRAGSQPAAREPVTEAPEAAKRG